MGKRNKHDAVDNIRFSIGAKLVTIISIIVIVSLGFITVLVSWLVQQDMRITAEENNFEANRRSATEAEIVLVNIRSNSRMLLQTITTRRTPAIVRESTEFFFTENPHIAAIFLVESPGSDQLFINRQFFTARELDETLAGSFLRSQRGVFGRAMRGETVILNAASHFSKPVLALYFPWQGGGLAGVLFSSESLNNNFGFGVNQSYMINTDGDILIHSDFALVQAGENVRNVDFIRSILNSPEQSGRQLIESDSSFMQAGGGTGNKGFFATAWETAKPVVLTFLNTALEKINGLLKTNISIQLRESRQDTEPVMMRKFIAFTKLNIADATVITGIEYDKVFEGIAATTRLNIYLTIAVLSIAVIFIWFFSKRISIPLKALAVAASKIEEGIFEIETPRPKSSDEIGMLTGSFQRMSMALNIFGKFTNKDVAVKAMRGDIKPGGSQKYATIFFSDIREFTAKCENFTNVYGKEASVRIVHWLNNYFSHMVDCIKKTNGVVDKFIGGAVMAHWGTAYSAGSPRKDAFNCIKAALMMRGVLYMMNNERRKGDHSNPEISIGAGIDTGFVTAGQIGSDLRMEYTVIGDPVNLASRVEALTKPLGADILITEDTWNLVGDQFITEEMPSVSVKGKEKPVRIFAVVNIKGNNKGPHTLAEVQELLGISYNPRSH